LERLVIVLATKGTLGNFSTHIKSAKEGLKNKEIFVVEALFSNAPTLSRTDHMFVVNLNLRTLPPLI